MQPMKDAVCSPTVPIFSLLYLEFLIELDDPLRDCATARSKDLQLTEAVVHCGHMAA